MAEIDYLLKVLILGDSSVGKTCLLLKYVDDIFMTNHMPTIGIDFRNKNVEVDDKLVKIQLWDTAGMERFKTITNTTLYNGVLGICFVYSIGDRKSFENIENWMKQIKQNANDDVAIPLIANKADLPERVVETSEGQYLSNKYKLSAFFETSAKTELNIDKIFFNLVQQILENIEENPKLYIKQGVNNKGNQLSAGQPKESKKEGGCC